MEKWLLKPAGLLPVPVSGADALDGAPCWRLDLQCGSCESWGAPAGWGTRAAWGQPPPCPWRSVGLRLLLPLLPGRLCTGLPAPRSHLPPVSRCQVCISLRLLFLCCLESLMLSYQGIRVQQAHVAKLQLEWGSASRAQGCHRLGSCRGCAPVPWVKSPVFCQSLPSDACRERLCPAALGACAFSSQIPPMFLLLLWLQLRHFPPSTLRISRCFQKTLEEQTDDSPQLLGPGLTSILSFAAVAALQTSLRVSARNIQLH